MQAMIDKENSALERRQGLHPWLGRPPGNQLAEVEKLQIDDILPDLFGYHLLQVGRLGDVDLLAHSRILHRCIVDIDGTGQPAPYPQVRGTATALPVESDSVDVVLLPHVLEFDGHPHEALRESFRVLVPEGHLLICGFNPRSTMGLWRLIRRRRAVAPWCGQFFSVNRIKDWLALLGFDILRVSPCFLRPSLRDAQWLERLDALGRLGNRIAPVFSGAYLMVARKRLNVLTPIKAPWRPKRRLVGVGLAEPSARVVNGD
jgi:SAM-dependent methyltransferase